MFWNAQSLLYGVQLIFSFFLFDIATAEKLCMAWVIDRYGDSAEFLVPAQNQAILKSRHCPDIQA